jgi:hypothetical protein
MGTPEGEELEKLNKELGRPIGTKTPTFAGVIWKRVSNPHLDKFRSDILSGIQSFPVNSVNNSNEKLNNNSQIKIYKNNFFCRKTEDVEKGPINITNIVNNLVQQGIIKKPYENNIPEKEYKNLQTLYYHPEKTGGRSLKRKAVSGGTRKRRKNRCRKNPKTKKCMKKKYNKKSKSSL